MLLVATAWLTMSFLAIGQDLNSQAQPASGQETWENLLAAGRSLRDQSHFLEAEQSLNSAVSLALTKFGETDRRYAESLNALAAVIQIR
jgi:hypothetical protein